MDIKVMLAAVTKPEFSVAYHSTSLFLTYMNPMQVLFLFWLAGGFSPRVI